MEVMKAAAARRNALSDYAAAAIRLDRKGAELRAVGALEDAEVVHIYARAAFMAHELERSDPMPEGLG